LCLAKYLSKFAAKFRSKYRRLRIRLHRELHRSLHLDLNLNLNLNLYPSLLRAFFAKSFKTLPQKTLASSFGSVFELMFPQAHIWMRLAPRR